MNIVAGRTRSAIWAVSVMNCSCTTVNRSWRAKPCRTSACSGATVIGFVFWISIALTGGPFFGAAFVLPGPGHGRDAQSRVHLRRTVAAAGKAIAETEERALGLPDRAGECLDLLHRHAANRRSPFRRPGRKMRFQLGRTIGVAREI